MNPHVATAVALSLTLAVATAQQCPSTRDPVQINTSSESVVYSASISPDGTWVAYQYKNNSSRKVIARRTDGSTSVNFPPVLQNQTNQPFHSAQVTWADSNAGGAGYQDVVWCMNGNSVVYRSLSSNGTVGQNIYAGYIKSSASQMRLQRQAIKDFFVCSYWLVGQKSTTYEVAIGSLYQNTSTVIESSTTGSFTPLDVDPTGRYVLYARYNGHGEEVVRADLVGNTTAVVGPVSASGQYLDFDSGFFGNAVDSMQFTHQLFSGNKRWSMSKHVSGGNPNHVPLTDAVTEEVRAAFVQSAQLTNPVGTKRWAVYSAAALGLGSHDEITMMPVGGGGQVVFDRLNTGTVRHVSMDRDAEVLAYSTYDSGNPTTGNVWVLDVSGSGAMDNRPLHISQRAEIGGTLSVEQPCSLGDTVWLYFALATVSPYPLAGFCGDVELDPATLTPLYEGMVSAGSSVQSSYAVPNDPAIVGTAVFFQGLRSPGSGVADVSRVVRLRIF